MKYKFATITLNITQGCNLRCSYCQVDKNPNIMSLETLKKSLDWITENVETPHVSFFGGEPMTEYEKIKWAILNYPNIRFGISTNVTLLTPEVIKFFFDHKISCLFSVDGIGEVHNWTRSNSWNMIANKLPILGELFPHAVFRTTITALNVGHLYETAYLAASLGFDNLNFLPDGISENWKPEDYFELKRQLTMLYNDTKLRDKVRNFADYKYRLEYGGKFTCCDGCTSISILTDGRFSLCGEQTENNIFTVGDLDSGILQEKVDNFWNQVKPCPIKCKANPICSKERCFSRRLFCNGDISERILCHCRWYNIMEEVINSDKL